MKKTALYIVSIAAIGGLSVAAIAYPKEQTKASQHPSSPQQQESPAPENDKTVQYPDEIEREMVEAQKAAQVWLKLVDEGKYEASWEQGSVSFKNVMPKTTWVQALEMARKPLGAVRSRSVKDQAPAMNPKRMPPGIYMVINFNTSFALASKSGEFMTMRKDPDGQWRVLDYRVN